MNPTGYEKVIEHLKSRDIYGCSEELEVYDARMKAEVISYNNNHGTQYDPQEAFLQYLEKIGVNNG